MLLHLTILCLTHLAFALEPIPDYLHICPKNDPKLTECLVQTMNDIRPLVAVGIPELNVPSIEPLELGDLIVSQKTQTQSGLQITAKNIKAYNSSTYTVRNMKVVEFGKVYTFDIAFKSMYVTGTYEVDGQILVLPIKGSGQFSANFYDAVGKNRLTFDEVQRDGQGFSHIKSLETSVSLKQGSIKLENLFNGDKLLGDTINDVINQNFLLVSQDIIPLVQRALNRAFKKIGNRIFSRFTTDQLFPQE